MGQIVTPPHGKGKIYRAEKGEKPKGKVGRPKKIPSLEALLESVVGVDDTEDIIKSKLHDIIQNLVKIATTKSKPTQAVQAAEKLLDRIYGKPTSNDTLTIRNVGETLAKSDEAAAEVMKKHGL